MVTGPVAVGKTTLVRALQGGDKSGKSARQTLSTDGIDLGEVVLKSGKKGDGEILLHVWDFGGQVAYRYTHQLFLTDNALYLILFNSSEPEEVCALVTIMHYSDFFY
tara:strand:- start:1222 stop:1542 length:321 start_codon:yes stop_codon:yes gene_type:complete